MKMLRLSALVLFAAALWAQPATQAAAPPDVDQALRARVTEFLDYHVRGEFRKAEALVAEDTKEIFYNRNKPRYMGCKGIAQIRYSDNFSKAYVVALCTIPMMIQANPGDTDASGKAQMPIGPPSAPIPMTWRVEKDGKWYWYLDPDMDRRSPFGVLPAAPTAPPVMSGVLPMVTPAPGMTLPPAPPAFGGTPQPAAATADPGMMAAIQAAGRVPVTAATFGAVPPEALHHVKLEKGEVTLGAGDAAKLKISNDAEDARQLMVLGQVPGIEAKLDAPTLKPGGTMNLSLKAAEGAKSGVLNIVVASTGEMLPVKITVK
jgi:hypothetical protein